MNSGRLSSARPSPPLVLGIDLGLSGARARVVDSVGRTVGAGISRRAALAATVSADCAAPGWVLDVGEAVRDAVRDAGSEHLEAIAIGAFGPVPVVVDDELRVRFVGTLYTTATPTAQVHEAIGRDDQLGGELWQLDVTGYVVSLLVGHPVMDRITASDHEGSELRVPVPGEPGALAGSLSPTGAEILGLPAGIPVLIGSYDSFVDLSALGVRAAGDAGFLLGSTLVLGVVADDGTAPPPGLRAVPHIGSGCFVGGWTSAAGRAVEWVDTLFGEAGPSVANLAAALDPGDGGVLALPHLAGERAPVWDDSARGALIGLTDRTTPTQIYRSIVDSVALSALDLVERLRDITGIMPRWRAAGGGFRNDGLARAMADAIGVPIDVVDIGDGRGAAVLAQRFLGNEFPSAPHRTIVPDSRRHQRLSLLAEVRRGLYDTLAERLHRLDDLDTLPTPGAPT